MTYRPQPIDTSSVRLDAGLVELTEYLARNTHEVWASGRVAAGWAHGERRDDGRRLHPDLVPYEQLSEAEKQLDRATALETLKVILALGYRITPPDRSAARPSDVPLPPIDLAKTALPTLIKVWQLWDKERAALAPELYVTLGERALKLGESLLAYDILRAGLRFHPDHRRARQLAAIALARGGATEEAIRRFEDLRREGDEDEDTLSGLGRAYKDRWEAAADPEQKRQWLERAFEFYDLAYRKNPGGYYGAINAATLAACLGRRERADELAREAEAACQRSLETSEAGSNDYWALATMGEAALVRRDFKEAEWWYRRAADSAAGQYGNVAATRRNARLLLRAYGEDADLLNQWLPLRRVVVFAGHMIDRPDRPCPRFPGELEEAVAAAIRAKLDELDAGWGYASAACGADILFLEAVAERGGEITVVLPFDRERFVAHSVNLFPGAGWLTRFDRLLERPGTRLVVASEGAVEGGISHEYANTFTFGLAGIRAWQLGAELAPLAVWDGKPAGDGPGGTAAAVARWRAFGCDATVIDLAQILRDHRPDLARVADDQLLPARGTEPSGSVRQGSPQAAAGPSTAPLRPEMMALLFADVVGFSKLCEEEIPLFAQHFLGLVAHLCETSASRPVQRNTWGDGLYFVFRNVADAGRFALELRDAVAGTKWTDLGFRHELSLRTGLHVGPVYACTNPVTGRPDYIGTHVSRAARIEPITPKGQVYASEVFAAIAFADRAGGFACEYVGKVGLAKDYGEFPTYHVRRSAPR